MIIAITNFALPEAISLQQAREIFLSTAPTYRDVPGLLKKHYLLSADGRNAGGIYLWNSLAQAQAMYSPAWFDFVESKYQTKASVSYFDSPVLVDNLAQQIISHD